MLFNVISYLWSDTETLSPRFPGISSYACLFQDPASPMMEGIINLHHDVMFIMWVILGIVCWLLAQAFYLFRTDKSGLASNTVHGTTVEIAWTIAPAVILVLIAIPTFSLLYAMDEGLEPAITLKAIGHQWYWSYEYSDYGQPAEVAHDIEYFLYDYIGGAEWYVPEPRLSDAMMEEVVTGNEGYAVEYINSLPTKTLPVEDYFTFEFDCFMVTEDDLESYDQLRLLETDQPICLPIDTHVRVLVTSVDVLHCWTVPALGVKVDACPGRLNQLSVFINQTGTFFGQCSELCGTNHAFMPIMLIAETPEGYRQWLLDLYEALA